MRHDIDDDDPDPEQDACLILRWLIPLAATDEGARWLLRALVHLERP